MTLQHAFIHIAPAAESAILFSVKHLIRCYQEAIADHGFFTLALSGGSTPSRMYQLLCSSPFCSEIEWERVHLFWSDERSVPPSSIESNYRMAMESGFKNVNIPSHHIHRMLAEENIEANALEYEKLIHQITKDQSFDLILLGIGEDGHTASLFSQTAAINYIHQDVAANYIPQKKTWRMTLTFPCINKARHVVVYAIGSAKAPILEQVFHSEEFFPCRYVGSDKKPALWILDHDAASLMQDYVN